MFRCINFFTLCALILFKIGLASGTQLCADKQLPNLHTALDYVEFYGIPIKDSARQPVVRVNPPNPSEALCEFEYHFSNDQLLLTSLLIVATDIPTAISIATRMNIGLNKAMFEGHVKLVQLESGRPAWENKGWLYYAVDEKGNPVKNIFLQRLGASIYMIVVQGDRTIINYGEAVRFLSTTRLESLTSGQGNKAE